MAVPVSYAGTTELVSRDNAGNIANHDSDLPAISADGRFVAFRSLASNLVPGDTNGVKDVFVHDRQTGVTEIVSVDSDGKQADGRSDFPSMSADGRFVAFWSTAGNLVPGDINGVRDIFVHDRETGKTEIVSKDSTGIIGNKASNYPTISADGRFVVFESFADNLVPNDTNGTTDIFVHDRETGKTEIVSIDSDGNLGNSYSNEPAISADGRFVAFRSGAYNLVADDTNGIEDIFVHDRETGKTEIVSIDNDGKQSRGTSHWPSISADGRYVAFESRSYNLVPNDMNGMNDIFVHDRQTGKTEIVSIDSDGKQANDHSYEPTISADGRYVAFESRSYNLVPNDTNGETDVFIHDRKTGKTEMVSVDSKGNPPSSTGECASDRPSISADGRFVAFVSGANDLVLDDTNVDVDVFVRDRQ
jgi:Tol biopolymer transport system component